MDLNETQKFQFGASREEYIKNIIMGVYAALEAKGYNPISQMVGYILSGDPTYITGHNSARALIMKVERDEVVEEILRAYIKNEDWM